MSARRRQYRDHAVGRPVAVVLEPLHRRDQRMAARQAPQLLQCERPDVANLEYQPCPEAARPARRDRDGEERRGRHENRVGSWEPARRKGFERRGEGGHVEDAPEADRGPVARHCDPAVRHPVNDLARERARNPRWPGEQVRMASRHDDHAMTTLGQRAREVVVAVLHTMPRRAGVLVDHPDRRARALCAHAGRSATTAYIRSIPLIRGSLTCVNSMSCVVQRGSPSNTSSHCGFQ